MSPLAVCALGAVLGAFTALFVGLVVASVVEWRDAAREGGES